jgi:hypothetical protein
VGIKRSLLELPIPAKEYIKLKTYTPYKGNQSNNVILTRPIDCLLQTTANISDKRTA